jgi:hypothetical protein
MKISKELLAGICIGIVLTIVLGSTIINAGEVFKTSNGAEFGIAHLSAGESLIPISSMPDEKPPLIIDGRTYVPLRAAINSVGGDVIWDGSTKTASLVIADTIDILYKSNLLAKINRFSSDLQFRASISSEYLVENENVSYIWSIEKGGREIKSWPEKSLTATSSYAMFTLNSDYDFPETGTYKIKLKIHKSGTTDWLTIAQRIVDIE